jgi:hypothetical protein
LGAFERLFVFPAFAALSGFADFFDDLRAFDFVPGLLDFNFPEVFLVVAIAVLLRKLLLPTASLKVVVNIYEVFARDISV